MIYLISFSFTPNILKTCYLLQLLYKNYYCFFFPKKQTHKQINKRDFKILSQFWNLKFLPYKRIRLRSTKFVFMILHMLSDVFGINTTNNLSDVFGINCDHRQFRVVNAGHRRKKSTTLIFILTYMAGYF